MNTLRDYLQWYNSHRTWLVYVGMERLYDASANVADEPEHDGRVKAHQPPAPIPVTEETPL